VNPAWFLLCGLDESKSCLTANRKFIALGERTKVVRKERQKNQLEVGIIALLAVIN